MIRLENNLLKVFLICAAVMSITADGSIAQDAVKEAETQPSEPVALVEEKQPEPSEPVASVEEKQPEPSEPVASVEEKQPEPSQSAEVGQSSVKMGGAGIFEELHLRDADIRRALEMLNVEAKKNIITTKEVTGTVTADLYRVTFQEALDAILTANGYVYTESGNFIYVMTAEQKQKIAQAKRKITSKMFRLSYVTAADIRTLITPLLSDEGSIAVTPAASTGIATSSSETGGNSYATSDVLVVRDYEDNLKRVAELISELDVRPEQVLIEATLLRARLSEDNSLGVDFNVLGGIDFNTLGSTTRGMQSVSTGTVTPTWDNKAVMFRTDFNSLVPSGGLTFGFLSNKIGFFVRALESITDVTVMANPKLLIINKQRGEVMVGNRDGYLTTTFTETTASQTVEFLETGTRLVVRPFIARDGYIRLEIHPEDSSGSTALVGQSALPSKTTTEITSNVLVRDGHTIIIGGLFREETTVNRSQTPLIGNIPYLGALFRSSKDETNREEVIILITPHIIRHEADEAVSEQIKDQVERFRIGHRKGLRWWGRSRLAGTHLRWARKALADGNHNRALWNVDMALSMLPRMEEAIRLKERLTKRTYWADEPRHSAVKYVIQQMIMTEIGMPVSPVIPPLKPRDGKDVDGEARKALGIGKKLELPLEIQPSNVEILKQLEIKEP